MTIAIELEPEIETQLKAAAESRGLSVEEYVRGVVVDQVQPATDTRPIWKRDPEVKAAIAKAHAELMQRVEERRKTPRPPVQEFLDEMAYHGPIPEEMKTQKITRAFIYGDHP